MNHPERRSERESPEPRHCRVCELEGSRRPLERGRGAARYDGAHRESGEGPAARPAQATTGDREADRPRGSGAGRALRRPLAGAPVRPPAAPRGLRCARPRLAVAAPGRSALSHPHGGGRPGRAPAPVPGRRASASWPPRRTPSPTACGCSGPRWWTSDRASTGCRITARASPGRVATCATSRTSNPRDSSDVKVPWELSRLQWLMPAGQAYLLGGDERYADAVRAVLEDWIEANPCAQTVNWSCTMEAALRILSWTWFFRVFHGSRAWSDAAFRERFLCALYLHADFTDRHFEISDVNGNHCTADGTGLAFAGLFFGQGKDGPRWQAKAWSILCERDRAPGLPGRRRLRGLGPVPPPGRRALPAARPLPRGALPRRPGTLPRAGGGDGPLRGGVHPAGRLGATVGRRRRRARPAARRAGPQRPSLPRGTRRCGLER